MNRVSVGVKVVVVVDAAPFSGAAVTLTNVVPQYIVTCCAAPGYVWLMGCEVFPAKVENMAMVSCRHELHVGRAPPARVTPRGREYG